MSERLDRLAEMLAVWDPAAQSASIAMPVRSPAPFTVTRAPNGAWPTGALA